MPIQDKIAKEIAETEIAGHDDLRVFPAVGSSHIDRGPHDVRVECVCGSWRRTLAGGHTLTELNRLLDMHRQAIREETWASNRRASLGV